MDFLVVTGMSGAGKSNAANALEDLGFYCVDNIPPLLIPSFVDLSRRGRISLPRVAIVTDARGGVLFQDINNVLDELSRQDVPYRILFLDASDEELVRRYQETRRKHPISDMNNLSIPDAVVKERELLKNLRGRANYVIDTTNLTAGQLKKQLSSLFLGNGTTSLSIQVMSFGYKYGPANEGNLVFDVRCLPNPYYINELRPLTGLDAEIKEYVMKFDSAKEFAKRIIDMVDFSVPLYCDEGKSQLVIAVGCTGGKHRSVVFAEMIYKFLVDKGYRVSVSHRDIEKT